jgi:hypothetical protein
VLTGVYLTHTRLSCTVMKTVHRLFEREGFAANHAAIDALHSEIRKDGYVYVECCPGLAGVITTLTSMAKSFELPACSKDSLFVQLAMLYLGSICAAASRHCYHKRDGPVLPIVNLSMLIGRGPGSS